MEKLVKALSILSNYLEDYNREYPTSCEHNVLYVCGVDLERMDADTVHELIKLGFEPGSDGDAGYYNYYWGDNFTQEEWEIRRKTLTKCFHSHRYGSC